MNSKNFSSEAEEIMSDVPGWLVSRGMTITGIIFITILSIAWFVKYPDIINAEVVVTSSPSPVKLVSSINGRIQLLKAEREYANKGAIIGYIDSDVDFHDIFKLKMLLEQKKYDSIKKSNFEIGGLEPNLSKLNSITVDIQNINRTNLYARKIQNLNDKRLSVKKLSKNIVKELDLLRQEFQIEVKKFKRDSILFRNDVISSLRYDDSKIKFIQKSRVLRNKNSELLNSEILFDDITSEITNLSLDGEMEINRINNLQESAKKELLSAIKHWSEKHLLISPIEGKVTYQDVISNEDYVNQGEELFTIIPNAIKIYGNAYMPLYRSGKVKLNQQINIKLLNYPAEQYGVIRGTISSISSIPNNDKYLLRIELENGLRSSYNFDLEFKPELKGEAEIITEDLRLLERLYYQLIKLVRN